LVYSNDILIQLLALGMVLIAKLEGGICLIVYFAFKTYCCNIADSTMTALNKIYLKVLVRLLRRENLICSFIWIIEPALRSVCSIRYFSAEVSKNLASQYQFCKTKTDHEIYWDAPEQMAIGASH
jgi:hypothetical protein